MPRFPMEEGLVLNNPRPLGGTDRPASVTSTTPCMDYMHTHTFMHTVCICEKREKRQRLMTPSAVLNRMNPWAAVAPPGLASKCP